MSTTNTNIKLQRSVNTPTELASQELNFGEPFFIDNTEHASDGTLTDPCNAYLVLGRKLRDDENGPITVEKSPVIKALSLDKANKLVFYDADNGSIINESGVQLPVNLLTTTELSTVDSEDLNKYYILCQRENSSGDKKVYKFTFDDLGVFLNGKGTSQGIAWNDYAEFRILEGHAKPGQVVCDIGNGSVRLSDTKLQACPHVVSDTFGHIIGDRKNSVPIAVSGRVRVAMDYTISNLHLGDCVCAGQNGLASKMTRQEIINYPDRILGVVCEEPTKGEIELINLDNRVWINIK